MADRTQSQPTEAHVALFERLLHIAKISALEEMASSMAHELNQPIGAIATFSQAAQRMLDRPDPMVHSTVEVLQHISHEALKAGQGIRRIRGLFGGHRDGRTQCVPSEVIDELVPILQLLARRRGANLACSAQDSLPRIAIDRLRIQHVLVALVQNALEAPTHNGQPPDVFVNVTGDRYGVQIAVEDRGVGIDESARAQLFHPFFTTKERGTGLGLASSRTIVEAHEGSLVLENAQGGTRFVLRLPASPRQEGAPE